MFLSRSTIKVIGAHLHNVGSWNRPPRQMWMQLLKLEEIMSCADPTSLHPSRDPTTVGKAGKVPLDDCTVPR